MILLDAGASTPLRPEVRAAMEPWLGADGGNPSSLHAAGRRARKAVEDAREKAAAALGLRDPRRLVFSSGATESNALAILGASEAFGAPGEAAVGAVEHPSVLTPFARLERRGWRVARLAAGPDGRVEVPSRPAAFASVQAVNHETGALQPIAELRRALPGALLHVDAAQAVGKFPLDLSQADLWTLSAHKLHGPRGVGALVVGRGARLEPLLAGGGQEFGLRAGTENVAGIVGFAEALALPAPKLDVLRDRLEDALLRLPGARRNGPARERAPHLSNLAFEGLRGDLLAHALDAEGLCISTGSACASGSAEPSPVLLAMGQPPERAREAVRFGVSALTTREEIDEAVRIVERTVARLRSVAGAAR
jgi:cysteine desulfurase